MRRAGQTAAMLIPVALIAIIGSALLRGLPAGSSLAAKLGLHTQQQCTGSLAAVGPYAGVAPGMPWRQQLAAFDSGIGRSAGIVEYYEDFGEPFSISRASAVARLGALPLVQLNPRHTSLAAIVSGKYDTYLNAFAAAVGSCSFPVILSFGHEMNGPWFPWSYTHAAPAVYRAAWRHIHRAFGRDRNVIWLWDINRNSPLVSAARRWWPGAGYVDWIGIDGYYRYPSETFGQVFGATFVSVRRFTNKPILIAETAVPRGPSQAAQIAGLFAGAEATPGLLGFVWFDLNAEEDWRIDNDPAGLAAFRRAAKGYLR